MATTTADRRRSRRRPRHPPNKNCRDDVFSFIRRFYKIVSHPLDIEAVGGQEAVSCDPVPQDPNVEVDVKLSGIYFVT